MIILNADGSILVAGKRHTVRFEDIISLKVIRLIAKMTGTYVAEPHWEIFATNLVK